MSVETRHTGMILPIHRRERRLLDRWRFAFEVSQIVGNAPNQWSVRVGVLFGSIHGPSNREELWNRFASAIFSRLEEEGRGAVKVKKASRVLVDPIQKVTELNQTVKVIIDPRRVTVRKFVRAAENFNYSNTWIAQSNLASVLRQ